MPHFHDFNPWAGTLAYVPDLEEWLDCLSDGSILLTDGTIQSIRDYYREKLSQHRRYDLYVLPDGSIGCRIGTLGESYLSPSGDDEKAKALWRKYSNAPVE